MSSQEEYLVLFADEDKFLCTAISSYLTNLGIKTAIAYDGFQASEMFDSLNPSVIIADLQVSSINVLQLLEITKNRPSKIPFIITVHQDEINTGVNAVQMGAYDYLIKPYQPEILYQKISQAIRASRLMKENIVLNELVSLYDITSKMTSTHNIDELLDITFQYCLQISRADEGSLQLVDKENGELVVVRKKGVHFDLCRSQLTNAVEWPFSKWVFSHGKSLLIGGGKTIPPTTLLTKDDDCTSIAVPLKISGEIIGVVHLSRNANRESFTPVDLNVIDLLASQAGIAINNANLYSSINQKLDELMLISTYSEQLIGVVDKYDVIRCLYETVVKYFPIDVIGFLIVQRRSHEFLYWSRGQIDEKSLKEIVKQVVDDFNKCSNMSIQERRVGIRKISMKTEISGGEVRTPLLFKHAIPVCWEDFKFGSVFFGASKDLLNVNEKIALLSSLVSQTRIALTNSKLYSDMKENYIRTIKALAIAVDAKDTYTHGHSENVMNIAEEIAKEMNVDDKMVGIIRDAGLLHDIGKIGIPGHILNKPGPLTYEEFNGIMKNHSVLGANIVKDVPFLRDLYKLILYHHEHYNGAGYPDGLRGEQIPIGARILHVADAFEAMTSNRPYRNSLGKNEALKRLSENSGQQFDPAVIDAFLRIAKRKGWLDELQSILQ
jgi:putative nucleotidyltransferase with HDIG domain